MSKDVDQEKVKKYEHFVNEVLANNLKSLLEMRESVYGEIAKHLELQSTLKKLISSNMPAMGLKTKVDLGCNFYAQAEVTSSTMFVSIGYGFFLEMTFDEALKYISKKVSNLEEKAEVISNNITTVKVNMRTVLEGLREIQNLQLYEEKPTRVDL